MSSDALSLAVSLCLQMTSPSSDHRGLIDDEIRDQPDLLSLASRSPGDEDDVNATNGNAVASMAGKVCLGFLTACSCLSAQNEARKP